MPDTFLSDGGSSYANELVRTLCKTLGIEKLQTTPYHCQANGMCERVNRSIQQLLAMHVSTAQDNWDELLPYILFSIRVSYSESTGQSPYWVLFGRDPVLPIDLGFVPKSDVNQTLSEKNRPKVVEHFHTVWQSARKFAQQAHERGKKYYDAKTKPPNFSVGDIVRMKIENFQNKSKKLTPSWHGGFKILSLTDTNATIVPLNNPKKAPKTVHMNR